MAEAEAALERFVHEVMIPLERTRALLLSIGKDRKSAQWDRLQVAFKRAENGRGWKIYTGDLVSSRGVTQSHRELTDWLKGVCNEARTAKTGMRLITKSKGA